MLIPKQYSKLVLLKILIEQKVQHGFSPLKKQKKAIKNGTGVTLNLSSNNIGDSNDDNNFPHKVLLASTQVSRLRKVFAKHSSANLKSSKIQSHKLGQPGGFLGRILGPILKTGLSLIGKLLKPITKSVLIPLGLMAAPSAIDVAIEEKNLWIRNCNLDNL